LPSKACILAVVCPGGVGKQEIGFPATGKKVECGWFECGRKIGQI